MNYTKITRTQNRNELLDLSEAENIKSYIEAQIDDPFSTDVNYFKALKKMLNDEEMAEYCIVILDKIESTYPNISFDVEEDNLLIIEKTYSIYKFFIKNIREITYIFLKEYIANNKNRKNLTSAYSQVKFDIYPTEEYGKKEYFILISKLDRIIKDIKNMELDLSDFIMYINRSNDSAAYVDIISELLDNDFIVDSGVTKNILKEFIKSDDYGMVTNKLMMWINKKLITPCLKELGYDKDVPLLFVEDGDDVLDNGDGFGYDSEQ